MASESEHETEDSEHESDNEETKKKKAASRKKKEDAQKKKDADAAAAAAGTAAGTANQDDDPEVTINSKKGGGKHTSKSKHTDKAGTSHGDNRDNPYAAHGQLDIKRAYNSATRNYGKLKKKFPGFLPHISHSYSEEIAPELHQLQESMEQFFQTMEFSSMALWDKFGDDSLYEKWHALVVNHDDIIDSIIKYMNSKPGPPQNNIQMDAGNNNILPKEHLPKPILAFKPKDLDKDASPEEYDVWKDNFEVYFEASNAYNCSFKTQSILLFTCLDSFMTSHLKKRSGTDIPTFCNDNEGPSHMNILDQYFRNKYPIHVRRADLFAFRATQDMKSSEFFITALQKMSDAQIMTTPVHDIMTSFLAHNCPDPFLRLELLRSEFISLNSLVNKALTFEMANLSPKNVESAYAMSRKKTPYQKNKQGQGNSYKKPDSTDKACPGCGSRNHVRKDCPHKDKTCEYCKIKGHLQSVCRRKKEGKPPPNLKKTTNQARMVESYNYEEYGSRETPPLLL